VDPPIIEPLGAEHDRAAFSCGVELLDRYLQQHASQDARNRVAAPFILRTPGSPRIVAYYTLSAFAVQSTELPFEMRRRLPRYPQLPAVLLGRLAVDKRFGGQGWGKVLLLDALRRSFEQARQIAALVVIVDAVDDAVRTFYERYGFQRFVDHEYRLYLPIKTIEQLLGSTVSE